MLVGMQCMHKYRTHRNVKELEAKMLEDIWHAFMCRFHAATDYYFCQHVLLAIIINPFEQIPFRG